jgi:hypothetical protein
MANTRNCNNNNA